MGNITAIIVVCSICGLLILILLFAYKRISKKNSNSKLDEEINKYKKMNEGTYDANESYGSDNKINKKQLKKEKKQQKVAAKTQKLQQKVTNSVNIENLEGKVEEYAENFDDNEEEERLFKSKEFGESYNPFEEEKKTVVPKKHKQDDFDDFMNDYSYSRAAVNKNLLKEIKNLSPKVKALVLGNIFNKFDD